MAMDNPLKPVVAIVGTTGTGKSQLAVDLARRFNGEIINCDAMQLYRGLPIITNKIPEKEQQGIPHHLLGCVEICERPWRIDTFTTRAIETIRAIHARNKLPILVGGTHYYIQSVLFPNRHLLDLPDLKDATGQQHVASHKHDVDDYILNGTTQEMMDKLREVDPVIANRWHPKERQKIKRSLEIWLQTGRPPSEVYEAQRVTRHEASLPSLSEATDHISTVDQPALHLKECGKQTTRFPLLMLWTHTEWSILFNRLNERVDRMIKAGLLQEVQGLARLLETEILAGHDVDQTSGIWVSIGFRQFQEYLSHAQRADENAEELGSQFAESTERTKVATRHYAKSQLRWIRNKLLSALLSSNAKDRISVLDTSNPEKWQDHVLRPAMNLVQAMLDGRNLGSVYDMPDYLKELVALERDHDLSQRPDLWTTHECELCGITAVTDVQWSIHLRSNRHKKTLQRQRKAASMAERKPP